MTNKEIKEIYIRLNSFKEKAQNGRTIQSLSLIVLVLSIIFYTLNEMLIFRTIIIISSISVLFSIMYLNFIIDPLWKEAIDEYKKKTDEYLKNTKKKK